MSNIENEEIQRKLRAFAHAASELLDAWQKLPPEKSVVLDDYYPKRWQDFQEVASEAAGWAGEVCAQMK